MENIVFSHGGLTVTTFVKGNEPTTGSVSLSTSDEIALFLKEEGKDAKGIALPIAGILDGSLKDPVTNLIENAKKTIAYFAPCLTFSHIETDDATLKSLMKRGYVCACKGTAGKHYADPIMVVISDLRDAGIPFENIYVSDYDTFDHPDILNSSLRGDKEKNVSVAK